MYVFIEYNSNYKEILNKIENTDLKPIVLFKINLENKNQIKSDLEQLMKLKQKIKSEFTAIQVSIFKIENSTIGLINNLKRHFDIIIGLGGLNKVNRFLLEQTSIDFIQDPQSSQFKQKMDFIHHFNSGINHILCKVAKENEINFLFSLNFLKSTNKFMIPKEIGRINQNLRFARKYNIKSYINLIIKHPQDIKNYEELRHILSIFELSDNQKTSVKTILKDILEKNKQKTDKDYISKDISIIK